MEERVEEVQFIILILLVHVYDIASPISRCGGEVSVKRWRMVEVEVEEEEVEEGAEKVLSNKSSLQSIWIEERNRNKNHMAHKGNHFGYHGSPDARFTRIRSEVMRRKNGLNSTYMSSHSY